MGLAIAVLAGAGLRLQGLDGESAWCDEALTTYCLPADSLADFRSLVYVDDSLIQVAPVYHVALYAWSKLWGAELYTLRLFSVCLGLVSLLLVYGIAHRIGGHPAAHVAAFYQALSMFQVYFAQEIRFYALIHVLALVSIGGLLLATGGRWKTGLVLNILANALLMWTHAFAALLLCSEAAFVVLVYWREWRRWVPWFFAHGTIGAAFLGWLYVLRYGSGGQVNVFDGPAKGLPELVIGLVQFAGGRFSRENLRGYNRVDFSLDYALTALALALFLYFLWRVGRGLWEKGWRADADAVLSARVLSACCFVGPFVGLFFLNLVWKPCFFPRYVIFASPALYIAIGLACSGIGLPAFRRGVVIALFAMLVWQNANYPRPFRPDYDRVARLSASTPEADTEVLVLKQLNYIGARYAAELAGPEVTLLHGIREMRNQAVEKARAGKTVWALFYRWNDVDDFAARMAEAGLDCEEVVTGGAPPLVAFRVVGASDPQ
jgi:hypothetical protein